MPTKYDDTQVEALAQRRFKYNYMCQQANKQLRDRYTHAQMEASNERVRRQLYDGNLEPTITPKLTEIPAYTKFLEDTCEQYKDAVDIDDLMRLAFASFGLMNTISMHEVQPLPQKVRSRVVVRAKQLSNEANKPYFDAILKTQG